VGPRQTFNLRSHRTSKRCGSTAGTEESAGSIKPALIRVNRQFDSGLGENFLGWRLGQGGLSWSGLPSFAVSPAKAAVFVSCSAMCWWIASDRASPNTVRDYGTT
jgi:hypothetical protein